MPLQALPKVSKGDSREGVEPSQVALDNQLFSEYSTSVGVLHRARSERVDLGDGHAAGLVAIAVAGDMESNI